MDKLTRAQGQQGPGGQAEERWGAGEGEDGVAAGRLGHLFLPQGGRGEREQSQMERSDLQLELRLVFEYLEKEALQVR